jgi:hypothetical protein
MRLLLGSRYEGRSFRHAARAGGPDFRELTVTFRASSGIGPCACARSPFAALPAHVLKRAWNRATVAYLRAGSARSPSTLAIPLSWEHGRRCSSRRSHALRIGARGLGRSQPISDAPWTTPSVAIESGSGNTIRLYRCSPHARTWGDWRFIISLKEWMSFCRRSQKKRGSSVGGPG